MGFSSQDGAVSLRTQDTPGEFPSDFATNAVAYKLKTGALAANRDLLIPDPEIGGGRDIVDASLGPVTFTGDYEFYVRLDGILTFLNAALGIHVVGPAGTADVQTLGHTGTITGGTFTLTFGAQTTDPIPWNATANQIQAALEKLSTIGAGSVFCSGGPMPASGVVITFDGVNHGTTTAVTATSTSLVGSTPIVTVTHTTTGASNAAGFQHVLLPSDDAQLPFVAIEENVAGSFDVFHYTDGVVNTLHFEADGNGFFMGTAGMIARLQEAVDDATDVSNLFDNGDLVVGTNVFVTMSGVQLAAKSMKFDLDNQFASDDYRLGSFYIGDLTPKRRNCTVGVTVREQDHDMYRQALYGDSSLSEVGGVVTKEQIVITAETYASIPGSSPTLAYSMSITLPKTAITPYALKVSGDDIMDDDIVFQALRPDLRQKLFVVRVVNLHTGDPA